MPCAMQNTNVKTVNGKTTGVTFTADPKYNLITIKGCNLGDTQGQAHLNGPFASGQLPLQIELWTDREIHAKVALPAGGELDQDNVSLVVAPANAPQMQVNGFKFYAERETVRLTKIPPSTVTLAIVTDTGGNQLTASLHGPLFFETPASGGFPGMAVSVERTDSYVFPPGQDYYDFSKLTRGFNTDHMDFKFATFPYVQSQCDSWIVGGSWDPEWDGDNIRVGWKQTHCHESPVGSVGGFDLSGSNYGLDVWVTGPKGVAPWPASLQ
jgi:hypothetical protein